MPLTLSMMKQGEKLKLSMNKGETFTVELYWDSAEDLDAHALQCVNEGGGAKASSLEDVLSCYNIKRRGKPGVLAKGADGSFALPSGSMRHSGDCPTGKADGVAEMITIDGSRTPEGVNEIPVFVTIAGATESGATFRNVKNAGIRIKDPSGKVLAEYKLSNEFSKFNGVQIGSLILNDDGWEFAATTSGFNADFNYILENFS